MSEFALNSSLDAAVRASNAQYDSSDVLDRLRVRLPHGTAFETGALLVHTKKMWPLSLPVLKRV